MPLDLRIEIKKGIQALFELTLDFLSRTLQDVHCHVRLVAVGELQGGVSYLDDLALGQQTQSVDQSQICHVKHLIDVDWSSGCEVRFTISA